MPHFTNDAQAKAGYESIFTNSEGEA